MKVNLSQLVLPEKDLRARIDEDSIDELADSMRDQGQIQAIGVKQTSPDKFEVVYGSRRTRAARQLGWETIRAELVEETSRTTAEAMKLIENVQRQDLTPIEEAYGLYALIGDGVANVRDLQRQTGKSRDWIRNRLELLDLPEDMQAAVQAGSLGVGVAKILGKIASQTIRQQYLAHAIENGCTTQQATYWTAQAEFAEVGQLSMVEHEAMAEHERQIPQIIEQRQNCFGCNESHTFRDLSMFTICRICMDRIKPQLDSPDYRPPPERQRPASDDEM